MIVWGAIKEKEKSKIELQILVWTEKALYWKIWYNWLGIIHFWLTDMLMHCILIPNYHFLKQFMDFEYYFICTEIQIK